MWIPSSDKRFNWGNLVLHCRYSAECRQPSRVEMPGTVESLAILDECRMLLAATKSGWRDGCHDCSLLMRLERQYEGEAFHLAWEE